MPSKPCMQGHSQRPIIFQKKCIRTQCQAQCNKAQIYPAFYAKQRMAAHTPHTHAKHHRHQLVSSRHAPGRRQPRTSRPWTRQAAPDPAPRRSPCSRTRRSWRSAPRRPPHLCRRPRQRTAGSRTPSPRQARPPRTGPWSSCRQTPAGRHRPWSGRYTAGTGLGQAGIRPAQALVRQVLARSFRPEPQTPCLPYTSQADITHTRAQAWQAARVQPANCKHPLLMLTLNSRLRCCFSTHTSGHIRPASPTAKPAPRLVVRLFRPSVRRNTLRQQTQAG